jgi:hypothetical protein
LAKLQERAPEIAERTQKALVALSAAQSPGIEPEDWDMLGILLDDSLADVERIGLRRAWTLGMRRAGLKNRSIHRKFYCDWSLRWHASTVCGARAWLALGGNASQLLAASLRLGNAEVPKYLISRFGNELVRESKENLLLLAVRAGKFENVELLLSIVGRYSPRYEFLGRKTESEERAEVAWWAALDCGSAKVIKAFLAQGYLCCWEDLEAVVNRHAFRAWQVLREAGVAVDPEYDDGDMLECAVRSGSKRIVMGVLAAGARPARCEPQIYGD